MSDQTKQPGVPARVIVVPGSQIAALTVIQPFAALLCLRAGDKRKKRVENRTWPAPAKLIGQPIAIHAGKARQYNGEPVDDIARAFEIEPAKLAFGAVVGIGTLMACLPIAEIRAGKHDAAFPWLREHEHAEGPWAWIIPDASPLNRPIACSGSQGIWKWTVPANMGVLKITGDNRASGMVLPFTPCKPEPLAKPATVTVEDARLF